MKKFKRLCNMKGRRVLITGGNGHLGKKIAETLTELGASIIILDMPNSNFTKVTETVEVKLKGKLSIIECDLESEKQRRLAIEKIKSDGLGLNCLINNASFTGASRLTDWAAPFEKQSLETWRRALEVNLTAPFHFSQAFTPELQAANGGNIINIASIYGELGPDWRLYENTEMGSPAAYSSSKGGLIQLTRWLATTLAPHIRVNAISPGGIYRNQPDKFVKRYSSRTPLGRMGTEDDFQGAVGYLATDLSSYVTGEIIQVDGGWSVW